MATRSNKSLIIILAVVALVGAAWFFVSPLFIDEVVDEEFVFPTRADVMAMTDEERKDSMQRVMDVMKGAPDFPMKEPMVSESAPAVVSQGSFRDADAVHRGEGTATLYQLPDASHLLRFEDFRVTNGPALVVYLAKHENPTSAADVKEGFLALGELKGNIGNQNYPIPADADISEYHSAVIWCELFDVLFSPAQLVTN